MIIDTNYLLPLARVGVRHDLLRAVAEGRVRGVRLRDLGVSLISVFELQAITAKLGIPPDDVIKAVRAVTRSFRVIPFYYDGIVRVAHELSKLMNDYTASLIVATAAARKEDLVTEDPLIHDHAETIKEKYGISVLNYDTLVGQ